MELNCTVKLYDKKLRYLSKWPRSVLSLEKKVDSYTIEGYLIWKMEKKYQTKYLISTKNLYHFNNNLEKKGLHYSKKKHINNVTIYFKIPHYNFIIQSTDDVSLKRFTNLVSFMSLGQWYFYENCLRPIYREETTHQVKRKTDYPPSEDFLKTTELNLYNLNITELDAQLIFNFQSLRFLNVSNNKISFLSKELGTLPNLEELLLNGNCLGNTCLENSKWEWIEQPAISQSLKRLYINNNKLTELPLQIGKLQSLISLDVSENLLTKLPQFIGTLQQLVWLDVSTNRLTYLPGSMRGMELCYLYTDNNPFRDLRIDEYRSPNLKVVSLLDLAAKAVKKYRLPYNNISSTWVRYLDNCKYCCMCRNSCFHSDIKNFKLLLDRPIRPVNGNIVSDVCQNFDIPTDRRILFKCYFCSSECYAYFCKTH